MTTRPRLLTSVPFWILIVASLASGATGLWLVLDKLTAMEAALVGGTATGVEVYVGQPWAVVGAVLLGAGVIGLLLALALGAASALVPQRPVEVVEAISWDDDADETVPAAETLVTEDPDVETASDEPAPAAAKPDAEAAPAQR